MRPRESRDRDGTPRSLAEFLARAGVRDRYPHYDLGAAEARLLRSPRTPAGRARRGSPSAGATRPGTCRSTPSGPGAT